MDIRQLRYFIAIAEEKQITAAAKRLHMAQPPLSQQLKKMEQTLGVQLVERSGKNLELTEAGHVLYKRALQLTKYLEESQLEVRETGEGLRGRLCIGVNTLSDDQVPKLLRTFQQKYPNVFYKIQQNESSQLCKMVRDRDIELAIVRAPLELNDFCFRHLKTEPFYFVTSQQYRPQTPQVTLASLQAEPLIIPSTEGLGVYQMIIDEFAKRQLQPHVICECSDITMLLQLVSSGFGTTILPQTVLHLHRGYDVQTFEIADTQMVASSVLIWLKDHYLSQATRHFIAQFD